MANAHLLSSTLPPVELVAAQLHNQEVRSNKNGGIFTQKAASGEEMMVPFDELSDGARAGIAAKVQVVYAAIDQVAEEQQGTKTRKAG
jgi:hypothetical protein